MSATSMPIVVTSVSSLVPCLYSWGLHEGGRQPSSSSYICRIHLYDAGAVAADFLQMMFFGWEELGLWRHYLLIGFLVV